MNLIPRVSVCRSRRQHSGQGSLQHLAEKDLWNQVSSGADKVLSPAGQSLVANAKGDEHGNAAALWCVKLSCLSCGVEPASVIP